MNIFKAKTHQAVNIDDAIEWTRRLRNVGQKVQRRQKGWWVAYYMYAGVTPVPMAEIIIDVTRTVPRGKLITWEHDPKLIEFKRPELKLEQPVFDLTKTIKKAPVTGLVCYTLFTPQRGAMFSPIEGV